MPFSGGVRSSFTSSGCEQVGNLHDFHRAASLELEAVLLLLLSVGYLSAASLGELAGGGGTPRHRRLELARHVDGAHRRVLLPSSPVDPLTLRWQ